MEVMYRVKAYQSDEAESTIKFFEFKILSETAKGYYIEYFTNYLPASRNKNKRFVLKQAKNPFAFIDKKAALENFIQRQKRYRALLRWKLELSTKNTAAAVEMLCSNNLVNTKVNQYQED